VIVNEPDVWGARRLFRDRRDAGARLAQVLARRPGWNPVVLGIPRGGVVVSAEIARVLGADHGITVARKISAPRMAELAIGAVSSDGVVYLDEDLVEQTRARSAYLDSEIAHEITEARRRDAAFGADRRPPLSGRDVIIADDGVATGATAIAAIRSARRQGASRIVFAVPVGPPRTLMALEDEADEVVCLHADPDFYAVGQFYDDFEAVSDAEVIAILDALASETASHDLPMRDDTPAHKRD
jgi:predicted phosphoribosyltransferase